MLLLLLMSPLETERGKEARGVSTLIRAVLSPSVLTAIDAFRSGHNRRSDSSSDGGYIAEDAAQHLRLTEAQE
jgi:hypothetical protein